MPEPASPTADTRSITSIVVGTRHRREMGNLRALADSMANVGLLHPVVVTPEGKLIAGERRLRAAELLGWADVPVHVVPLEEIVRGELAENTVRLDFQLSEAVAIKRALEPTLRKEAKERQAAHAGTAPGKAKDTSGKFPEVSGETRDKAAEFVGMSGRTLDKAEAVVEAANQEPEKYADLVVKMDTSGKANGAYKQLKTRKEAERISTEPPPLPTGPFRVIVADPPWRYDSRAMDPSHRSANPYADMDIDAIRALPIAGLAADDSLLWLWTTNAHMREAFTVLDAWGFEHKTILTWVKNRIGTGDWLRGQTEHCLFAVRGHPTVVLTNQSTVLHAKAGAHSEKPDDFYALIEALCPGSRVDIFARKQRHGWATWGQGVRDDHV